MRRFLKIIFATVQVQADHGIVQIWAAREYMPDGIPEEDWKRPVAFAEGRFDLISDRSYHYPRVVIAEVRDGDTSIDPWQPGDQLAAQKVLFEDPCVVELFGDPIDIPWPHGTGRFPVTVYRRGTPEPLALRPEELGLPPKNLGAGIEQWLITVAV